MTDRPKRTLCALLAALTLMTALPAGAREDAAPEATAAPSEEAAQASKTDAGAPDDSSASSGYSLLFTDNPVPDIAERCRQSVVGVMNVVSTFDMDTRDVRDESYSFGSGVVIDEAGYVLTNAHVIEGADKARVQLSDYSELDAEIVGYDTDADLALLYVEDLNLPAMPLGDSSKLRVGELLVAIGNPGGYYGSVSVGVVSALNRDIEELARPMEVIQTDAAMSPGISGGALLNSCGELVGITTLGVLFYEGLNFAIPINTALEIADEIKEYGKVRKPGIGIMYTVQIGPDEPLRNHLPAGLKVAEVTPDMPADKAGMQVDDVIYSINGERVTDSRELAQATKDFTAGDTVTFTVYRKTDSKRPVSENFVDLEITLEFIN